MYKCSLNIRIAFNADLKIISKNTGLKNMVFGRVFTRQSICQNLYSWHMTSYEKLHCDGLSFNMKNTNEMLLLWNKIKQNKIAGENKNRWHPPKINRSININHRVLLQTIPVALLTISMMIFWYQTENPDLQMATKQNHKNYRKLKIKKANTRRTILIHTFVALFTHFNIKKTKKSPLILLRDNFSRTTKKCWLNKNSIDTK